ncbi:MAG: SDR family NAD(P)-dependent oxidoreductase, partial [Armatimonadota bacterium]
MDLGIAGRVALVAAGTKGIGRALAEGLQAEGCRVAVCARTPVDLPDGMRFDPVDVSQPADLERWVADVTTHLGPPDILITNTGGPPAGPGTELTVAQWHCGVASTLMNGVRLVRGVAPGRPERGGGSVVRVP